MKLQADEHLLNHSCHDREHKLIEYYFISQPEIQRNSHGVVAKIISCNTYNWENRNNETEPKNKKEWMNLSVPELPQLPLKYPHLKNMLAVIHTTKCF